MLYSSINKPAETVRCKGDALLLNRTARSLLPVKNLNYSGLSYLLRTPLTHVAPWYTRRSQAQFANLFPEASVCQVT